MKLSAGGFSNNPFMMGYDNRVFSEDEELGFIFPQARLIASKKFLTFKEICGSIKRNKPTILNLGDSSTSGWNGNKVSKKRGNPQAAFFTYKTYSDLLGDKGKYNVINAGIPGYSSLQGKLYLRRLLRQFFGAGFSIDYVTLYFGNNDSTYNAVEDKVKLEKKVPSKNNKFGYRVSPDDFKDNLTEMIQLCVEYKVQPILICPLVNFDWEPGIRSNAFREEFELALTKMPSGNAKKALLQARKLYEQGKYRAAKELDYALPRIKDSHIRVLRQVAKKEKVALIEVKGKLNEDYFVDYCHPSELANHKIAQKLSGLMHAKKQTKRFQGAGVRFELSDQTYSLY